MDHTKAILDFKDLDRNFNRTPSIEERNKEIEAILRFIQSQEV